MPVMKMALQGDITSIEPKLNYSLRSLATRHRQAVNKKAICQSVSAHSSNQ